LAKARLARCPQAGHSNQWKRQRLKPVGTSIVWRYALMTRNGFPDIQAATFSRVSP
jgi:hypothetical protein